MALIKAGIARLSINDLSHLTYTVLKEMSGNPHFPNPTPSLADLEQTYHEYLELMIEAQDRGKRAVLLRNSKANELRDMLRMLVAYVTMISGGDGSIIVSSGFELRKEPKPIQPLPKPRNLQAKRSNHSTVVELRWEPVPHALNYLVEMAPDQESFRDTTWVVAGISSRSKFNVTNLVPGKYYQFRVKAYGRRDDTAYSNPTVIMAA